MSEKTAVEQALWDVENHESVWREVAMYPETIDMILQALRTSGNAECGCVTHDDCKGTHSICEQSSQIDVEALIPQIIENTSIPPGFTATAYLHEVLEYLTKINLLSRESAWMDISELPPSGKESWLFLNAEREIVLNMSVDHFHQTRTYPLHLKFLASHCMPLKPPAPPLGDKL